MKSHCVIKEIKGGKRLGEELDDEGLMSREG